MIYQLIEKSLRYWESTSGSSEIRFFPLAWNNFYHRHRRLNIQGNPFDSSVHVNIQRFRSFVHPPLHSPPLISCRAFPPVRTCDSQRIRGFVIRDENKLCDIIARTLSSLSTRVTATSSFTRRFCGLIWFFIDVLFFIDFSLSCFLILYAF